MIKISEEKYNMIKNKTYCAIYDVEVYEAISNGTPLPKGHGDLVDRDAVYHAYDYSDITMVKALQDAETIIEADRGRCKMTREEDYEEEQDFLEPEESEDIKNA